MTDLLETVRETLADKLGVKVSTPDAEAVVDALSRAGVALVIMAAYTSARVEHADPMLAALAGTAGRAPGAYDDQAYRE